MEYHDRVLKCSECSAEFVFTAGEQMFFADKGFKNEPKRCKACKAKRAEGGGGGGGHASPMRSETKTNCSQCGKETTVPFRPTQGRPVFLPGVLPAAQSDGSGVEQKSEEAVRGIWKISAKTEYFAWGGSAHPSHFFETTPRLMRHRSSNETPPTANVKLEVRAAPKRTGAFLSRQGV